MRRFPDSEQRKRGYRVFLAPVAMIGILVVAAGFPLLAAEREQERGPEKVLRYRATRAMMADQATGRWRVPTQAELDTTVTTLKRLTHRPEVKEETASAGGGIAVDLGEGFAGVILARPADDGTVETLCVFTFEEAVAFLGLVVDETTRGDK